MNLHYKTKNCDAMLTSGAIVNISEVSVNNPRIFRHIYVDICALVGHIFVSRSEKIFHIAGVPRFFPALFVVGHGHHSPF